MAPKSSGAWQWIAARNSAMPAPSHKHTTDLSWMYRRICCPSFCWTLACPLTGEMSDVHSMKMVRMRVKISPKLKLSKNVAASPKNSVLRTVSITQCSAYRGVSELVRYTAASQNARTITSLFYVPVTLGTTQAD
jgi:hypothetical protein